MCVCVCDRMSTYKILCERLWQVKGHPPCAVSVLVDGKREEVREERQKQIFCLSHLLGGDPAEALSPQTIGGTEEETQNYLHLTKIFSDDKAILRVTHRSTLDKVPFEK